MVLSNLAQKFEEEVMSDRATLKDVEKVAYIFDTLRGGEGEPAPMGIQPPIMLTRAPTEDDMTHVSSIHTIPEDDEEQVAIMPSMRQGSAMSTGQMEFTNMFPAQTLPMQLDKVCISTTFIKCYFS